MKRRVPKVIATLAGSLLSALPLGSCRSERQTIPLWQLGAPGFEGRRAEPEEAKSWWVRNVHNPSLTVVLPPASKATGTAVVIAPGGGFRELVFEAEGMQPAEFLSQLGIAAFALKYRLPQQPGSPYTQAHVREDAYRAIRLVRHRAKDWGIDVDRVGMLGFSAGGALVAGVAYTSGQGDPKAPDPIDREEGRPDFQMLIYPSGAVPDDVSGAPPTFLLTAADDEYGCDRTTLELLNRLHQAKIPVEAHFLARGQHGFNMGDRSSLISVRNWPRRMADWLSDSGYLERDRRGLR